MSADPDKFDHAIDGAVRDMLDVDPPADLRAKVIARIDARPASSFQLPAFSVERFVVLAGGAAVLVLIVLLLTQRPQPTVQEPVQARAGADQVLPSPEPVVPESTAPVAHTHVARASSQLATAASTDTSGMSAALDPLTRITPIEVAPIAQSSIAPQPIGVHPLNPITEVQIAPLTPPNGRD